ncbi:ribose-phosphate pyrophosphokinase [Rapidithrix thailandica]|uniref:ribose-phosphate diphosphokinase n=1 Tax=Rapidithrix thailandica TaxID=413964 RepID=A0AAW9S5A5_9BACT
MTNKTRGELKIFACRSGERFADAIVRSLNEQVSSSVRPQRFQKCQMDTLDFANGESKVRVRDTVRGADTYVVQQCFDPTSERTIQDNAIEALQAVRALKSAGAYKVTLVLPEHPWARQDKSKGRETITSRLFADFVQVAGADNVLTTDLHADQITGFYDATITKIDNLRASHVLLEFIKQLYDEETLKDLVVMAPDSGGAPKAEYYAKMLGTKMAHAHKTRSNVIANKVEGLEVLGEVENKHVFVIDDMVDTGGSARTLCEKLFDKGVKSIKFGCTHGLFNKGGLDKLTELGIHVVTTDTIPRTEEFLKQYEGKLTCVSLSSNFAEAIYCLNQNESLESVYGE